MNAVASSLSRKFIGAVEDEWQLYRCVVSSSYASLRS